MVQYDSQMVRKLIKRDKYKNNDRQNTIHGNQIINFENLS